MTPVIALLIGLYGAIAGVIPSQGPRLDTDVRSEARSASAESSWQSLTSAPRNADGSIPASSVVERGAERNGLALGLSAERATVRQGDPIVLEMAIVNDTDSDLWIDLPVVSGFHFSGLLHTSTGTATLAPDFGPWARMSVPQGIVRANSAVIMRIPLKEVYPLTAPGTLDVRIVTKTLSPKHHAATLATPNTELVSNTVSVTITN